MHTSGEPKGSPYPPPLGEPKGSPYPPPFHEGRAKRAHLNSKRGYGGWNPPAKGGARGIWGMESPRGMESPTPQKKLNIDYYFLLLLKYFVVKNSFKRNSL